MTAHSLAHAAALPTRRPRWRRLAWPTTFLLIVALSGGCDEKQRPPESPKTPEEASPEQLEQGIVLQTHEAGSKQGAECHADIDCIKPLRCAGGRCSVPPSVDGGDEAEKDAPRVIFGAGSENEISFYLEVADNGFERQQGLMHRLRIQPDWGMIFVFDQPKMQSFWMLNTYLGLDMVFVSEDGEVVNIAKDAKPLSRTPSYKSTAPARYVIELAAGTTDRKKITAGQRVRLLGVPGKHSPAILQ